MLFEDFHSENFCEVHICHGKYVDKFCKKHPPSEGSQKEQKKKIVEKWPINCSLLDKNGI